MACETLRNAMNLCQQYEIQIGTRDMLQLVCEKCDSQDVCPSISWDDFELMDARADEEPN